MSIRQHWRAIAAGSGKGAFSEALVADLPEPARRYLTHAITPGTQLAGVAELHMRGTIRTNSWLPFRAREVLAPGRGFVWRALVLWLLRVDDYWTGESAGTRLSLLGVLPLMHQSDEDIVRSAAGRAASEAIWVPSALLDAEWDEDDEGRAVARLGGHELKLRLSATGAVRELSLERWGNPDRTRWRRVTFGAIVEEERSFGGYTIPSRLRAGWFFGSDRFEREGEFFRATLVAASHR